MAITLTQTLEDALRDHFANLPTSDPKETGALWSDSGTIKLSAGPDEPEPEDPEPEDPEPE